MTLAISVPAETPSIRGFLSGRLFEDLAFCRSRLTTVQELLRFSASDSHKLADALYLAELLYVDQIKIAHRLMARPVLDIVSIERAREAICSLEGMPGKQALAACADRLHDAQTALESTSPRRAAKRAGKWLARAQRGLYAQARSMERLSDVFEGRAWRKRARSMAALLVLVAVGWFGVGVLSDFLELGYFRTRMGHFFAITEALGRYRAEYGSYPVSANDGSEWNGIGWKGDPQDWIPGLAPRYLARVPHDPRNTAIQHAQYVYRSNGTDYKLIALLPEDCQAVIARSPKYSDPARNAAGKCAAYGMWTTGAAAW